MAQERYKSVVGDNNPKAPMSLLDLPNELISRIVLFLDSPSPFDETLSHKPISWLNSRRSWQVTDTDSTPDKAPAVFWRDPLKQLSLTCRVVRSLTLPVLFKHAVLHPSSLTAFLVFLNDHNLIRYISSLVADVPAMHGHIHPAWWAQVLNAVPATRFSICAPPEVFAEMVGIAPYSADAWAFDMDCQILRLDQSPEDARTKIDYDHLPSLLVARPWTNMAYNEGSSLLAYTTYEFFLRRTPSLLTALVANRTPAGEAMFAKLLSFEFIAIFPFYNHVDEVLRCVRQMKRLRKLSIKLCPEPDSTILRDGLQSVGGHMDVNDPWNECDTSWVLIAHTVVFLTMEGALEELHMHDVRVEGVKSTLESSLAGRLDEWWTYHGSGVWRRNGCLKQV